MWAATAAHAAGPAPEVSVTGGKIRGSLAGYGGAVFKGIPVCAAARPATCAGANRVPVKSWAGVRDADRFRRALHAKRREGASSSEDCLYLNVWTPEWPAKSRKAVMVWFHGGGNFAGAATGPPLRRRKPGPPGRPAGDRAVPARRFRLLRASRTHEGVAASRLRQLRTARPDRGAAVGARQHREFRRRPRQRHDLRRIGGIPRCQRADGVSPEPRLVPPRHRRERTGCGPSPAGRGARRRAKIWRKA